MKFGPFELGPDKPTIVCAEIGINHNGDLDTALRMIDEAHKAGADVIKTQMRSPEICVPKDQWGKERDTPWGRMSYIEYKKRIELSVKDYTIIHDHCLREGIQWTASVWDEASLVRLMEFEPPFIKIPSAMLTNRELVHAAYRSDKPVLLSTGMSTEGEIRDAVQNLDAEYGTNKLALMHCVSAYPCPNERLNLRAVRTLRELFPTIPVGYSGHEVGLATTLAAVVLGAEIVERHFTLDRAAWGSDQAASVEPQGFARMVKDIQAIEAGLGDGALGVDEIEEEPRERLRGTNQVESGDIQPTQHVGFHR